MRRHRRAVRLVVGLVVLAVALPGVALAGKKVVSGQQTDQIKASLKPARAGAHGVKFGFSNDYESTTPPAQPPYNVKSITLVLPTGMVINPKATPACKRSQIDANKGDVGKCPANTIVGHGTVVANAAPTIPTPITGTITEYNAVNDTGESQQPKGTRNIILWVKTSVGVNQAIPFRILKRGAHENLQARFVKPAAPGVTPGSFTIEKVTLSDTGRGISDPPVCSGSWLFTLKTVNYFGQPSITAHDKVKCKP